MPTRPRLAPSGFTLLELLLVLVVVGILAGTVIAALPNVGQQRRIQTEAERLALAFELARGEALRRNELWGLAVSESGYAFHRRDADGEWLQVGRRPLAPWSTEQGISLVLLSSPAAVALPAASGQQPRRPNNVAPARDPQDTVPDVAIHPGGEATPFVVSVAGDGGEAWVVRSDGFARAEALPAERTAAPLLPRFR